jgi:hypothetical protein
MPLIVSRVIARISPGFCFMYCRRSGLRGALRRHRVVRSALEHGQMRRQRGDHGRRVDAGRTGANRDDRGGKASGRGPRSSRQSPAHRAQWSRRICLSSCPSSHPPPLPSPLSFAPAHPAALSARLCQHVREPRPSFLRRITPILACRVLYRRRTICIAIRSVRGYHVVPDRSMPLINGTILERLRPRLRSGGACCGGALC